MNDSKGSFTATHVYANNLAYANGAAAPYTLTATVVDKDQGSTTTTSHVTVNNVPPAIDGLSVTPPSPTQGSPFTLTGHVTDPGAIDPEGVSIVWGDGTTSTVTADPATRLFSAVHSYNDVIPAGQASTTEAITVTATDDVGPGAPATLQVTVLAAPSTLSLGGLTVAPGAIAEGGSTTATGSFTDTTAGATHIVSFAWGDGTTSAGTVDEAHGTYTATHTYLNQPPGVTSGAFAVTATVTGSESVSATAGATVTVADVAPSVVNLALTSGTINEGGAVTLTGAVTDPGLLDSEALQVTWGDGVTSAATVDAATRLFSATHIYANNPAGQAIGGAFAVKATATDDVGETGSASTSVVVNNVAPAISGLTLSAGTINEGGSVTLSGVVTDPGLLDSENVNVSWGDGGTSLAVINQATRGFTATYVYQNNAVGTTQSTFPVTVTATDGDRGTGTATASELVKNVAPAITGVAFTVTTANEGDVVTLVGHVADAGPLDPHNVSVAWGDGQVSALSYPAATGSFAITHIYKDNPAGAPSGAFTATASVTDDDGAVASATAAVTVKNVAPVITAFTDASSSASKASVGQALGFNLVFTDPGVLDTHTVTIGWGDGTKAVSYSLPAAQLVFAPTHSYAKAGTYYVTVQVTDKDGGVSAGRAALAYIGTAPVVQVQAVRAVASPTLLSAAPAVATPMATAPVSTSTLSVVGAAAPLPTAAASPKPAASSVGSVVTSTVALDTSADAPIQLLPSNTVRIVTRAASPIKASIPPAIVFDDASGMFDDTAAPASGGGIDLDDDWLMVPLGGMAHPTSPSAWAAG